MKEKMNRLMELTGMREEDLLAMRPCDLDCSGETWIDRIPARESETGRMVAIGPEARKILEPLLKNIPDEDMEKPIFTATRHPEDRDPAR